MFNAIVSFLILQLMMPVGIGFFSDPETPDYGMPSAAHERRLPTGSLGVETTAKSVVVIDDDGVVLYEKKSDEPRSIASVTKLMTALVLTETVTDWNQTVQVTQEDQRIGGLIQVRPGDTVTAQELFNVMMVASSNEAAAALARIAGPDFVDRMNQKAVALEMKQTSFVDPTGLEAENTSTALDLVKLARAAFGVPMISAALRQQAYVFTEQRSATEKTAYSTNQLLDSFINDGTYQIIGAKTGYLEEAGYCLLLTVEKKGAGQITIALLGIETIDDRWLEAKAVADWIFGSYRF